MNSLQLNRWLRMACVCAVGGACFAARADDAPAFGLESIGGRFGLPVSSIGAGFKEAEGFAQLKLPCRWGLGGQWHLEPRVDLSLGWLADARVNSILVSAGPAFVLGWGHFPLTLEGGCSPTYLSRYHFSNKNLGFPLEFTSRLGVNLDFATHFRVGYRFQHMSNGGLSGDNPGLNMHIVAMSYVF